LLVAGGTGTDNATDIVARPDGGFLVAGYFGQQATFGEGADEVELTCRDFHTDPLLPDIYLASYDPLGKLEWVRSAGGQGSDIAEAVALGSDGEAYLVGRFTGQADFDSSGGATVPLTAHGEEDGFVARYERDGALAWAFAYGGAAKDSLRDVCVLGNGDVAVIGYAAEGVILDSPAALPIEIESAGALDVLVARLSRDGEILQAFLEGGDLDDYGMSIAAIGLDGFVAGGMFTMAAVMDGNQETTWMLTDDGAIGMFVGRYDGAGRVTWAVYGGGIGVEARACASDFAVGEDETIYVAGFYRDNVVLFRGSSSEQPLARLGPPFMADGFLARLDGGGTPRWIRALGSWSIDLATSVVLTRAKQPIVAGFFTQRVEFGGPESALDSSDKNFDAFIGGFSPEGEATWGRVFTGVGQDAVTSIGVTSDGSGLIAGGFENDIRFSTQGEPDLWVQSRGGLDAYVLRILFEDDQ
jgi:hypothetical protein